MNNGYPTCRDCGMKRDMRDRRSHGLTMTVIYCDHSPKWAKLMDGAYSIYQKECPVMAHPAPYQLRLW